MKKAFSIFFAIIILFSGMHFTIATHFCGGEIASKKLSLTGSLSSCGMESAEKSGCTNPDAYDSNCCKNQVESYSIDSSYENIYKIAQVTKSLIQVFYIPVNTSFNSFNISHFEDNGVSPPDIPLANTVDLAKICISRI